MGSWYQKRGGRILITLKKLEVLWQKGKKDSKSIISLSTLGVETPKALLFIVFNHLLQDSVCLFIVGTGEGRLHWASIIDNNETVPLDSLWIKGKPVFEVISSPDPADSLGYEFNILDFVKGDSLSNTKREVVWLDGDTTFADLNVFIVVDNRSSSVHIYIL